MTFTRLTLGEPRLRGRVRGAVVSDCTEPLLRGTNVMADPGAENQLTGSNSEIAAIHYYENDPIQFQDGTAPSGSVNFIHVEFDNPDSAWPVISTANPRSGTDHIRASWEFGLFELVWGQIQQRCVVPDPAFDDDLGGQWHSMYSARVEPGDFVEAGLYAMFTGTQGTPTSGDVWVWFYDVDGGFLQQIVSENDLTSTYAPYSVSGIAPSGSYYLVAYIEPGGVTEANGNWDFDDFWLEVTQ